jgi:signal transduction histidine kinase
MPIADKHLVVALFTHASISVLVRTSNIQGTGLGLHIVSRYAEMLDGKIECNGDMNCGTEMVLNLSVKPTLQAEIDYVY